MKAPFPAATLAWNNWSPLVVHYLVLYLLWRSDLLLVRCACWLRRLPLAALFALNAGSRSLLRSKCPSIASREKLLAGKQEVAEVAEVAGDAERVLNGGSKATGSPPLVHREARSEQAANSSKSSRLRREPRALIGSPHAACCRGHRLPAPPSSWDRIWSSCRYRA